MRRGGRSNYLQFLARSGSWGRCAAEPTMETARVRVKYLGRTWREREKRRDGGELVCAGGKVAEVAGGAARWDRGGRRRCGERRRRRG